VRKRSEGDLGSMTPEEFIAAIQKEKDTRSN
jgi:threonyl-tRNA synthetase